MVGQSIRINDILIEDSHFSTKGFLYESEASPTDSFKQLGILYPVVVYKDSSGHHHLIDGRKRMQFAKQTRHETIDAVVLPDTTIAADIVTFILYDKRKDIEQSIMNRVQFVCFAMHLNVPELWIVESLCRLLGFRPYRELLKDAERIYRLSEGVKIFCHEKKYSLKQIVSLTHYPEEILLQVMKWGKDIQLTASLLEEIASNMKDYLRAQDMDLKDFLNEAGLQEIMESSLSPRDKSERLREFIRGRRFPILSEVNARMERTMEVMNLPREVSVSWDRTLENKNVDVTVHLKDMKKYDGLLKILNSSEMKQSVERILEEL